MLTTGWYVTNTIIYTELIFECSKHLSGPEDCYISESFGNHLSKAEKRNIKSFKVHS